MKVIEYFEVSYEREGYAGKQIYTFGRFTNREAAEQLRDKFPEKHPWVGFHSMRLYDTLEEFPHGT